MRPTLPTGISLNGHPPVVRASYLSSRAELYELEVRAGHSTHLLLIPEEGGFSRVTTISAWLELQDQSILHRFEILPSHKKAPLFESIFLRIGGRRLSELRSLEATEKDLTELLSAMIALVSRVSESKMFPLFHRELTWRNDDGQLTVLMPHDQPPLSDKDKVISLATAFYGFAAGIDQTVPTKSPLMQWAKFSGHKLSSIIDRCFAEPSSRASINTLDQLSHLLSGSNAPPPSPAATNKAARTGLAQVAGMQTLKQLLLQEVVLPVRDPEPYKRYGLSIPNGILLFGPPGCGKTYIARKLAEELGHFFLEIIPSELASPYVHQSVIKIRETFDLAAERAPTVLFIDEFEALVPSRAELGGHQQYKAEEVNEFLSHLNECAKKHIFVIAATNEPQKIDAAVRRTGRLDKLIYVGPPDLEARREMLALHLGNRPVGADIRLEALATELSGYSASDIKFLVDEAAREALKDQVEISTASFRRAMQRIPASVSAEVEVSYKSIQQRGQD